MDRSVGLIKIDVIVPFYVSASPVAPIFRAENKLKNYPNLVTRHIFFHLFPGLKRLPIHTHALNSIILTNINNPLCTCLLYTSRCV